MLHNKYRHKLSAFVGATFLFLLSFHSTALAQNQEVIGTATAELIEVLAATEVSPLAFGRFFIEGEGTSGSLIVDPLPAVKRTAIGNAIHPVDGGTVSPAIYEIRGYPESTLVITLPTTIQITHISNPSFYMTVNQWAVSPSVSPKLDVDGKLTLFLGASLHAQTLTNNPAGVYNGTYSLVLSYN